MFEGLIEGITEGVKYMIELQYLGNKDLLKMPKTGFLASNTIPSETVLRCYDWATKMRQQNRCVMSGFNSKLEQDVLHFLLKGKSPIIIVLARKFYKTTPTEWVSSLDENRLLIISTSNQQRQSRQSAMERNFFIADICDELLSVGVTESSSLIKLVETFPEKTTIL